MVNSDISRNHSGSASESAVGIEHIDGLYSYAFVLSRNHAEAEDLVQETYVRAIQAMDRLRADSNLKAWLFTILRNIWLNQLRRRRTSAQLVDIDGEENLANVPVEPSKDPYAFYVSRAETEQVRRAIQNLPADFREIILLREYEELSYQEIAGILHCPIGTVMSRLGRARSKLKSLLAETLQISPLVKGRAAK